MQMIETEHMNTRFSGLTTNNKHFKMADEKKLDLSGVSLFKVAYRIHCSFSLVTEIICLTARYTVVEATALSSAKIKNPAGAFIIV